MEQLNSGLTVLQKLEQYAPVFLESLNRVERTGRLDAQLNLRHRDIESHLNNLLEQYHAQNVEVEFIKATTDIEPWPTNTEVENYGQAA